VRQRDSLVRELNVFEAEAIRPLAEHEFEQIRRLAHTTFGLDLKPGKEELVSSRLGRLVRTGRFRSFHEYYRHVVADRTGEALARMIDALATNHTAFLREPDHFDFLRR
jgi:chemotaxis protein methyltransferase CheR